MKIEKTTDSNLLSYTLRLGDNALVLGQRLIELVAHGPELEEELATANIALDYLGQARMFYSYAGELEGQDRSEDDFAFLRDPHEFHNVLLVEQPNGHFGDVIVRQVLFELFYRLQLESLADGGDKRLAEIASRAVKEIDYHLRHVSQWLVRLGDGTAFSHRRVQQSMNDIWRFTGEMFAADTVDEAFRSEYAGPDLGELHTRWHHAVAALCAQACLDTPEDGWMAGGGRQGVHGEEFPYLLAEMQHLQRVHPGVSW